MEDRPGDEEGTKAGEGEAIGVIASAITPGNSHLWKKGQSGNPAGRPPKERETAVLNLMRSSIDPQKIVDTVLDLIEDRTSWRAREAGARLYLAYMVGMPVQRSITASGKLETILNRLGEMDDSEFDQVEQAMRGE